MSDEMFAVTSTTFRRYWSPRRWASIHVLPDGTKRRFYGWTAKRAYNRGKRWRDTAVGGSTQPESTEQ